MNENERCPNVSVSLRAREDLFADGVTDILSFDDTQLLVETALGKLCVEGEGLRVSELSVNDGRLTLKGRIDGLYYLSDESRKKSRHFGRKD